MFVSHQTPKISYEEGIDQALRGGCRFIQLRMKDAPAEKLEETALRVRKKCDEYGALFIIDDNPLVAKRVKADGVHLGKEDIPVEEARHLLGNDFIIGATANTAEDVSSLAQKGADYIGCGPFRFTATKRRLAPIIGLQGYREIISKVRARGLFLPVYAIGGITLQDIPKIMDTGVDGVALSGAILNSTDPEQESRKITTLMAEY